MDERTGDQGQLSCGDNHPISCKQPGGADRKCNRRAPQQSRQLGKSKDLSADAG